MKILALDIGGSSIKHGIIEVDSSSSNIILSGESVKLETNQFLDLENKLLSIVSNTVENNSKITSIGISTTGSVDKNLTVINAGHFEGYKNVSWSSIIKNKFPHIEFVFTANDGRASTWAEYVANQSETKSHVHLVVGTGVGGGIVLNDNLLLGESGQAGYIGHQKITEQETIICSCKKKGCVETLASTRGIESLMEHLTKQNYKFGEIINLAKQKDKNAMNAILKGGYWLGIGIGNCMNIINPGSISVGGGVIEATNELSKDLNEDIYFNSLIKGVEYASHSRVFSSCKIAKSKYGNTGGIIGAALLTFKNKIN